jgi:tripartite-type tricarboxylate transporter receptor subunit TctC
VDRQNTNNAKSVNSTRRRVITALVAAPFGGALQDAIADNYPSRPIRCIVPWPAGGVADVVTRRVAVRMEPLLGQSIVIENKAGASGMIGADFVAKAPPDGYTILRGDLVTHAIDPYLFKAIPYDPIKDFQPISRHGRGPMIFVVHSDLPVRSMAELTAYAKAHPGLVNYGGPLGGPQNLVAELYKQLTGAEIVHVPYKGEAPALTDLIAGQIQMMVVFPLPALPFVQSGKLRALAATGDRRLPVLPDVPTVAEVGLPGLEMTGWGAFFAPAGTPRAVIDKLNAAIVEAMKNPEIVEIVRSFASEPVTSTPEELAAFLKTEMTRWAEVVRKAGVRIE